MGQCGVLANHPHPKEISTPSYHLVHHDDHGIRHGLGGGRIDGDAAARHAVQHTAVVAIVVVAVVCRVLEVLGSFHCHC